MKKSTFRRGPLASQTTNERCTRKVETHEGQRRSCIYHCRTFPIPIRHALSSDPAHCLIVEAKSAKDCTSSSDLFKQVPHSTKVEAPNCFRSNPSHCRSLRGKWQALSFVSLIASSHAVSSSPRAGQPSSCTASLSSFSVVIAATGNFPRRVVLGRRGRGLSTNPQSRREKQSRPRATYSTTSHAWQHIIAYPSDFSSVFGTVRAVDQLWPSITSGRLLFRHVNL